MQNDEYTPEVEQDANQFDTTVEETTEEEVETTPEAFNEVDWKAEALKWQAIAKRKAKQAVPVEQKQILTNQYLTREEGILIAKGIGE